jgi:hypothetical protein
VTWWLLVLTFVSAFCALAYVPRLILVIRVGGKGISLGRDAVYITVLGWAGLITIAASRLLP